MATRTLSVALSPYTRVRAQFEFDVADECLSVYVTLHENGGGSVVPDGESMEFYECTEALFNAPDDHLYAFVVEGIKLIYEERSKFAMYLFKESVEAREHAMTGWIS